MRFDVRSAIQGGLGAYASYNQGKQEGQVLNTQMAKEKAELDVIKANLAAIEKAQKYKEQFGQALSEMGQNVPAGGPEGDESAAYRMFLGDPDKLARLLSSATMAGEQNSLTSFFQTLENAAQRRSAARQTAALGRDKLNFNIITHADKMALQREALALRQEVAQMTSDRDAQTQYYRALNLRANVVNLLNAYGYGDPNLTKTLAMVDEMLPVLAGRRPNTVGPRQFGGTVAEPHISLRPEFQPSGMTPTTPPTAATPPPTTPATPTPAVPATAPPRQGITLPAKPKPTAAKKPAPTKKPVAKPKPTAVGGRGPVPQMRLPAPGGGFPATPNLAGVGGQRAFATWTRIAEGARDREEQRRRDARKAAATQNKPPTKAELNAAHKVLAEWEADQRKKAPPPPGQAPTLWNKTVADLWSDAEYSNRLAQAQAAYNTLKAAGRNVTFNAHPRRKPAGSDDLERLIDEDKQKRKGGKK